MSTDFGMPKIQITFESLGLSAIRRSERGIAMLILKQEDITKGKSFLMRSLVDLPESEDETSTFTEENERLIRLAFAGEPYKLKVELYDGESRTLSDLLKEIQLDKVNYYSVPLAEEEEKEVVLSWQKMMTGEKQRTIKYVAYDEPADDKHVINFVTPRVVYDGKEFTGQEFTTMIASVLAGLDLQRSATYYDFHGLIDDADLPFVDDEDKAVEEGKLFLTFDGEFYKLSRGVNSLVTHTAIVGQDQSKIRIIEAMDLILDDIRDTFLKEYVGKILNTYRNKQQFMAIVNRVYFPTLFNILLEPTGQNFVDIDMEANTRYAILRQGEEAVDEMTEMQIKTYNTGSNVFLHGKLSLLDAMEDLYINFFLE